MASTTTSAQAGPTTGAKVGAVVFWVVAIGVAALMVRWSPPAWVWALRIAATVAGIGVGIALIVRENAREGRGLPPDRDKTAFDLWTVAHTLAGVVMGAWGLPGVLAIVYTIAWEIFEMQVPGFGDGEIMTNRLVDVLVAWGGWILLAGIVALGTGTEVPWLLPLTGTVVRP